MREKSSQSRYEIKNIAFLQKNHLPNEINLLFGFR